MTVYNDETRNYITNLFAVEDEVLWEIRKLTVEKGLPDIGITPEEGKFIHLLVRACGAYTALEIGALGGYSGVWIARALSPGGHLFSLEKSGKHASVARSHFSMAGVDDRVTVVAGDAHQLLPAMSKKAPFDFVFIDAEKSGYMAYYEWAVANLRPGGVIAAHNVLWGGAVAQEYSGEAIDLMKQFNRFVASDTRVASSIYPAGDGTLVAVRLAEK